jgi:hypothetical protein
MAPAAAAAAAAFVGCKALTTGSQGIIAGASLSVAFAGTDEFDTDSIHDTVTNNTRLTVPAGKGGYYAVGFSYVVGAAGANLAVAVANALKKNTSTTLATVNDENVSGFPSGPYVRYMGIFALSAGDFIELRVTNNDATEPINVSAGRFWAYKVG